MNCYVAFFKSRGVLPWLVRVCQWRWWAGQRFANVPAHVGILVGGNYYEAISKGCQRRVFVLPGQLVEEGARLVLVTLPFPMAALAFLEKTTGDGYDFDALALDIGLGDLTGFRRGTGPWQRHLWDCSERVYIALRKGGEPLPPTSGPARPNDLRRMLAVLASTQESAL